MWTVGRKTTDKMGIAEVSWEDKEHTKVGKFAYCRSFILVGHQLVQNKLQEDGNELRVVALKRACHTAV